MLKSQQIPSVPIYECVGHVTVCLCVFLTVMIQKSCSLYSTFIWLINENSLEPHIDLHLPSPRSASASSLPPLVSAFILHLFLLTFSLFTYNSHSLAQYCKGQSNYTSVKTKPSEVPYHSCQDLRGCPSPHHQQMHLYLQAIQIFIHKFSLTHNKMIKKKKTNAVDAKFNTHNIFCVIQFLY